MEEKYITELFAKALKFISKRKGIFTSDDLSRAIKCAPRTARAYCLALTIQGVLKRLNTHPKLTYKKR